MNKFAWTLVLVLATAMIAGCGDNRVAAGGTERLVELGAGATAPVGGASVGGGYVAVVDLQALQEELGVSKQASELFAKAQAEMQTKLNGAIQPLLQKRARLQKELQQAVKKMPEAERDDPVAALKNPEVSKLAKDIEQVQVEMQMLVNKHQQALQKYQRALEQAWQTALQPALDAVAREKGIHVIVQKQAVVYSQNTVNLTGLLNDYFKNQPVPKLPEVPPAWEGL